MKTDVEQLTNILAQFSQTTISEVLGKLPNDYTDKTDVPAISKSVSEYDIAGEEILSLTDGKVEFNSLGYQERIIGENNLLPVYFLEEGVVVQQPVAKAFIKNSAGTISGYASGFMVSPSLFLTNNHVYGSVAEAKFSTIDFNYQDNFNGVSQVVDTYTLHPDSVFRTNTALDYTLVRVNKKSLLIRRLSEVIGTESEITIAGSNASLAIRANDLILHRLYQNAGEKWGYLKLSGSQLYAVNQHLNIVQHPGERKKEIAINENHVTSVFANAIRYQSDTEPGSSGSPVFNNNWDLVALHHAAGDFVGGVWTSNQGMRIDKIVADLRAHFGAGSAVCT